VSFHRLTHFRSIAPFFVASLFRLLFFVFVFFAGGGSERAFTHATPPVPRAEGFRKVNPELQPSFRSGRFGVCAEQRSRWRARAPPDASCADAVGPDADRARFSNTTHATQTGRARRDALGARGLLGGSVRQTNVRHPGRERASTAIFFPNNPRAFFAARPNLARGG
jgi:hypothetical protein